MDWMRVDKEFLGRQSTNDTHLNGAQLFNGLPDFSRQSALIKHLYEKEILQKESFDAHWRRGAIIRRQRFSPAQIAFLEF